MKAIKENPCKKCKREWMLYFTATHYICEECREVTRDYDDVVYGVACDGFVKVGVTGDYKSRFRALTTSIPLEIHTLFKKRVPNREEALQKEAALHEALSKYRVKGEWFTDCNYVRRILNVAGIHVPQLED